MGGWCGVMSVCVVSLDYLCRWQVQVSVYCASRIPAHLSWRSGKRARLTCVQLRVRASLRANVLSLENLNVIIRAIN